MARNRIPVHSRECRPHNRLAVNSKQASATVTRLLQWKKHNDAKREVKARLQEDERIEEEEHFLSLSKALSARQVKAAALRNYQAASKLRWKKLMLQSIAERQQLDEEEAECTFRPKLIARSRSFSTTRTCRSSCAVATVNSTDQPRTPSCMLRNRGRRASERKEDVFKRLYKPQTTPIATIVSQHDSMAKRISPQTEAAFIARQERDQVNRQNRRSKLAAVQGYPHKPKLSRHTEKICAALRENKTDQVADHRLRQRRLDSSKQVRYTIPTCSSTESINTQPNAAYTPFSLLLDALQQQEQRMRRTGKYN